MGQALCSTMQAPPWLPGHPHSAGLGSRANEQGSKGKSKAVFQPGLRCYPAALSLQATMEWHSARLTQGTWTAPLIGCGEILGHANKGHSCSLWTPRSSEGRATRASDCCSLLHSRKGVPLPLTENAASPAGARAQVLQAGLACLAPTPSTTGAG